MYQLLFFAPDGDYVKEGEFNTKDEAWERAENIGSRWIFYPIPVVAHDKTVVDTPQGFESFKRKAVKKLVNYLEHHSADVARMVY